MKVHYLLRGERYWSAVLAPPESRLVEERLKHDGILVHYNTNLSEVLGRGGRVAAVNALAAGLLLAAVLLWSGLSAGWRGGSGRW